MEKAELVEGKVDWKGRTAVKNKHGGVWFSSLILASFALESAATLALAVNLVTYFNGVMHFSIADASNQLTNYMGTAYILTIVVAFLADTCIGRFYAVLLSAFIELVGLIALAVQASYPSLKPPACIIFESTANCQKVEGGNAALLFVALYLVAAGTAGIKAALPTHGADQFNEKDPVEAEELSSFFNGLLLALCMGGAISLTLIVWIQENKGWDKGFAVSAAATFIAMIVFAVGLPRYRINVSQGTSAITEIVQVFVASIRNQNLPLPDNPAELYEIERDNEAAIETEFLPHRDVYRFLDRAAIQRMEKPETPNPWKLCTVTQVENAKIIVGMVPIFCCTIIMTLCLAQLQTFSIEQGITMDTRVFGAFNIPPASLPILPILFMIVLIPLYDRAIVPFARRFTGHRTGITHLQRIGVGLVLSSISMATAALMEGKRKRVAREHGMVDAVAVLQPLPISVFWLSFQFFIFGVADMFTYVGLLEFFYSEAPKAIKSISTCFLWSSMAFGYYLSSVLVNIVNEATKRSTRSRGWLAGNNINKNHVNLFYWLLSLLSLINFFVYLFVSRRYKYRPQAVLLDRSGNKN